MSKSPSLTKQKSVKKSSERKQTAEPPLLKKTSSVSQKKSDVKTAKAELNNIFVKKKSNVYKSVKNVAQVEDIGI